ncbi:ty3-gypsy retrotransposon protein [Cucumis melo var. makuwa]|uniref:Ty3-gypsy retrotransposon protein n=1 Tax=Cucumis melo var. makuwa TaxID=1194695 RepID=A0A5D3CC79_CUCMM|nr:ty3-gypsy retrotransposon protein [Cucumis melo var. makuwa]TYK08902.1 ty3-gypsy retrotransposon protein [Cucumis melo var. makuwa]
METDASCKVLSRYKRRRQEQNTLELRNDVDRYLSDSCEELNDQFDVLTWWKLNAVKYLILSKIAQDIFAISVSTVAFESAFNTGGRILDSFRSSLSPKTVEALICTQIWIRGKTTLLDLCPELEEMEICEKFENGKGNASGRPTRGKKDAKIPPRRGALRDDRGRGAGCVQPDSVPDQLSAEAKHLRDFRKYNPTTFDESLEDSTKDQMWLSSVETIFRYMKCPNDEKVQCVVFMLTDKGTAWWETIERMLGGDVGQITWEQFKESLRGLTCPRSQEEGQLQDRIRRLSSCLFQCRSGTLGQMEILAASSRNLLRQEKLQEGSLYVLLVERTIWVDVCLGPGLVSSGKVFATSKSEVERTGTILTEVEPLDHILSVSTPFGESMLSKEKVKACQVETVGHVIGVTLLVLDLHDFDVILGMDWLAANHASIDCSHKEVALNPPLMANFKFKGEGSRSLPKVISAMKASKLLNQDTWSILASVVDTREVDVPLSSEPMSSIQNGPSRVERAESAVTGGHVVSKAGVSVDQAKIEAVTS